VSPAATRFDPNTYTASNRGNQQAIRSELLQGEPPSWSGRGGRARLPRRVGGRRAPPRLRIDARSRYELWRLWTIDGEGPVPGGRRSLERLRSALEAVAAATGGVASLPSGMVIELERASGVR